MWSRNVPMDISGTNKQRKTGRRRYYGRRRRGNAGKQALRKVNKIERVLKKTQNLKSHTTNMGNVAFVTATPQTQSLILMQRGDTNYLREGDQITLKNMTWRIHMAINTAEQNPVTGRFVLIYDRRPSGAQAAWGDVYNNTSIVSLLSLAEDTKGRFQVLHDQMWTFATGGTETQMEKGFIDLKNKRVLYNANAGAIGDVQQGNLFAAFFFLGNNSNVIVNGYLRVRFVNDN